MATYNAPVENGTTTETRRRPEQARTAPQGMTTRDRQTGASAERAAPRGRPMTSPLAFDLPLQGFGSPFTAMRRMMEDMDRLIENAGIASTGGRLGEALAEGRRPTLGLELAQGWVPAIEAFEKDGNLVVRADLPGLRREDVELDVNDGVLTIQGERKNEHEEKREGFFRSERRYGRFVRQLALPDGMTGDDAKATFTDGVLEVTLPLPKREETRRKIEIR